MFRLLVSAGGTGGGVYPALATIAALGSRADVLWLGGIGGMEADLVARAGIRFEAVPAAGLHGVGLRALPRNVAALARGTRAALSVVRRFRPQVMLLTGGYVGIPAALAGRGVPKVLFVPDVEPALAAKWIGRMAKVIAVSADDSRKYYSRSKRVVVTGYPTRPDLVPAPKPEARQRLGLAMDGSVLVVLGGSRGARSINEALWAGLEQLLPVTQVIHLTGQLDFARAVISRDELPAALRARYFPVAYLHEEMASAYAAADLAIGRAGASTLGELPLFGLPAILVPYPHAWRYQHVNADFLARRAAAVVLSDERLATDMVPTALALLSDPGRLAAMSTAARRQASPDSARRIADLLESEADRPQAQA
jgi:UDP-N-acetylglucosamine--N-acetylmuramyl-(pentapeptide) pyrophosphoryl-undecaprenol N-acetylglucosamine transferase